jgi:predicted AAA+ superfamily ATPase
MYVLFQIKPYTHKLSRSLQKPPKIYFFDNADVDGDEGARFENLIATHLLKMLQLAQDYTGYQFKLAYLRDKEKHEVDFIILKDNKPVEIIEAKYGDVTPSNHLKYFAEKLNIDRAMQITAKEGYRFLGGKLKVTNIFEEFSDLNRYIKL